MAAIPSLSDVWTLIIGDRNTSDTYNEDEMSYEANLGNFLVDNSAELQTYNSAARVDVNDSWYEVIELPNKVYAIFESGQGQIVHSFLIIGQNKSILFDTGLGVSDLKAVVEKLTKTPIMVINSHSHFDHIGSNSQFSEVYCANVAFTKNRIHLGFSNSDLEDELDFFTKTPPNGFDSYDWSIQGTSLSNIKTLLDQEIIDLGDRQIQVIYSPGHTEGSLALFEQNNQLLFVGDNFYLEQLGAYHNDSLWGYSNLDDYAATFAKWVALDVTLAYSSHYMPLIDPKYFEKAVKAFENIKNQTATFTSLTEYGVMYKVYNFGDFQIKTE